MSLTPSTMLPLGTRAPDFSLSTTEGDTVSLDTFNDKKVIVIAFICNHCPYVQHIKKGLIQVYKDYENRGVGFLGINANDTDNYPEDSFENMKSEMYPFPYAFDETQNTAKAYKAACTPDIYVFDENRNLVYRGQIDYSRPGNNIPVTGDSLREALDAALSSGEVVEDQKPSIGCNIKWRSGNEPDYF